MLINEADAVVRARVVAIDERVSPAGDPSSERPTLRIEVLDVIKGPVRPGEELRTAQHGHGVPHYEVAATALIFLRDLSRSRELDGLAQKGNLRWYSGQEHDDDWLLTAVSTRATLGAARRYAAMEEMLPERRKSAMQQLTMRLLRGRDDRLARSALVDLSMLADAPILAKRDAKPLLVVVHDSRRPIDVRAGLLAELQRRRLVDADGHWARLLRTTHGPDQLAVMSAAGARAGPKTRAELAKRIETADGPHAVAAVVALGSSRHPSAVVPLSQVLRSEDPRLAMAAVRALGLIGTSDARAAIERAAKTHPDSSVRRRAEAELELMSAR